MSWYPAKVVTASTGEPVTPTQVREQLSGSTLSDDAVDRLIVTERGYVERYCGIRILDQELDLKCDCFADFNRIPIAPLSGLVSIAYVDLAGAAQTIATEALDALCELRADDLEASIALHYGQTWPQIQPGSRITVKVDCGWEDAEHVPGEIISAILLRISKLNALSRSDPLLRKRMTEGIGLREWDTTGTIDKGLTAAVADLLENYRCWAALA